MASFFMFFFFSLFDLLILCDQIFDIFFFIFEYKYIFFHVLKKYCVSMKLYKQITIRMEIRVCISANKRRKENQKLQYRQRERNASVA